MKLTKADAARQLGISRTTLYKLIEQGQVSATPDGRIDSAELVRAAPVVDILKERTRTPMDTASMDTYPRGREQPTHPLDTVHEHSWTPVREHAQTSTVQELVDTLRDQIQLLREELQAARAREQTHREELTWLRHHFDQVQQRYDRLLEAPRPVSQATPPRRRERRTPPPVPVLIAPPPGVVDMTTPMPAYNPDTHMLGVLCPRGHDWQGTGQSLRKRSNARCLACDAAWARAKRRQARPAVTSLPRAGPS